MSRMITITISEESQTRIIEELLNAKNAIEHFLSEEAPDLDYNDETVLEIDDDYYDEVTEWQEITKALNEIGG